MNIYNLITQEENAYRTVRIQITEGFDWNMYEHVKKAVLYKNSQLLSGKDDNKPIKNIVRPILNLQYRAEGFDVKDILIYVDDAKDYYKSFLLKKYHDKWAVENGVDTFIDNLVESYVDFGLALVKKNSDGIPEVVPLQRLAFCDQTDILSGTIAEKHFYNPNQLREMVQYGWDSEAIETAIQQAQNSKPSSNTSAKNDTPSKYIEVYEVHGQFPKSWLTGEEYEEGDEEETSQQLHICAFSKSEDKNKTFGLTFYKGKEKESPYMALLRDGIYGRAVGLGGVEELEESQVWTTYIQIAKKGMLDASSKIIFQTSDTTVPSKNNISRLNNLAIIDAQSPITPINNFPSNISQFDNWTKEWDAHGKEMGAAFESIMGDNPPSGTPFKLQELVTAEAHSLHEYRKGKIAAFVEEIYRKIIIPKLARDVSSGKEFLTELEPDELEWVVNTVVENAVNRANVEKVLNGELPMTEAERDAEIERMKREFSKKGNKMFFSILEKEFSKTPMGVKVNVAGKQKNLYLQVDKLVNVFRQIASAPQILDDPRMAKIFNQILEASGLNQIDMNMKPKQPIQPIQPSQPTPPEMTNPAMVGAGQMMNNNG